ncbi:MAG: hypothetical protein ACK4HV_09255, partial [Parachlamydiaceae bacterium]
PYRLESTATLPPGDSGAIGAIFNSIIGSSPFINSDLDIQLVRYANRNTVAINAERLKAPFRHLHKIEPHDPEIIKIVSEALKNDPHVFLRTKCACLIEFPYWFSDNDLEKDIKRIVSCLFLKGLIGSKLRLDIEPFETAAKTLALDFKNALVFKCDHSAQVKAYLLLLPFYQKLAGVAKRLFELFAEHPDMQEKTKNQLKALNVASFEQLKEEDTPRLADLNRLMDIALKENSELFFSREMQDDYELIDGEKRYKIPKGFKVVFPCTAMGPSPCPGFQSGLLALRVLFIFLILKGTMTKEIKSVRGSFFLPATKISYYFKTN